MMSKYLFKPRGIKKERPKSAWAAALASFFMATDGVSNTTQSELIDAFSSADPADEGGLPVSHRDPARGLDNLKTKLLAPQGVEVDRIGKLLLADAIEDKLRSSHVVLLHSFDPPPPDNIWNPQAWLVYGIDNWIIFMDGATGLLAQKKKVTEFPSNHIELIFRP
jgi:hypothetical protein